MRRAVCCLTRESALAWVGAWGPSCPAASCGLPAAAFAWQVFYIFLYSAQGTRFDADGNSIQALIRNSSVRLAKTKESGANYGHESPTLNDQGFTEHYRSKEVSVQDGLELVVQLDLDMPERCAFEV